MTGTELENLIIRLVGDATSYLEMLSKSQAATKQAASVIESAAKQIQGFQGSIEGFAKGALGVLGTFGLVTSLRGAFDAYVKVDQAAITLRTTIEASGRDVKSVTDDYNDFATQISAVTTATKGQVKGMLQQAEMRGIEGEKAKQVVQTSVALTGILGGEASAHSHLAIAVQEGNLFMVKRALHLHNIKDKGELVLKVQKQLELGWKLEQEKTKSLGGQIDKLYKSLVAFSSEIGAVVAEYVRPLVEWLTLLTDAFKKLDPATKKVAVAILTVALALPLIKPALIAISTVLGVIFAPLASALGTISSLLLSLLTPIGIISVAVVALGAMFVNWSEVSGTALIWLGERWDDLVKFFKPAVDGIRDALKAANLPLAFDILWTQILLSCAKGVQPIQDLWAGAIYQMQDLWLNFSFFLKTTWINTTSTLRNVWAGSVQSISETMVDFMVKFRGWSEKFGEQVKESMFKDFAKGIEDVTKERDTALKDAERARKEGLKAAEEAGGKRVLDAQKRIEELEKIRDTLVKEASEQATKVPPIKVPKFEIPKIPDQTVKVHTKWDATEFDSAEAISRLAEFRMSLAAPKEGEHGGHGEKPVPRVNAAEVGTPDANERIGNFKEATDTLKEIKDILGKDKSIKLGPAGLTV